MLFIFILIQKISYILIIETVNVNRLYDDCSNELDSLVQPILDFMTKTLFNEIPAFYSYPSGES